jgi:HSP20 family protein
MALITWQPVGELNTIQNEMNRLFDTFFDAAPRRSANAAVPPRRWIPSMDLIETEDRFVLRADLPGLSDGDVSIELVDNVLTLSGQRESELKDGVAGYSRIERAFGAFSRSLTLPDGTDPEGIEASFDRGVLEVRIPKPEQRKPHKFSISVGSAERDTIEAAA